MVGQMGQHPEEDMPLMNLRPNRASSGSVEEDSQNGSQQEQQQGQQQGQHQGQPGQQQQVVGEAIGGGSYVPYGKCKWDCGPAVPLSQLMKTSARALWQCQACHNGWRAITKACTTKEQKQALKDLQDKDPELFKMKVRACRIAPGPAGASAEALGLRRASVVNIITKLSQKIIVQERGGVIWLTKEEFVDRFRASSGDDAAGARFDGIVNDNRITKMTLAGSPIRVPVMAPPRTDILRQREFEIQLQASGLQIESAAMTENAMAELASVGCGPNPLSHDLFGDIAVQAQAQGMVGSSTGQLLPPAERQAPLASSSSLGSLGLFDAHAPADRSHDPGQLSQPVVRKKERVSDVGGLHWPAEGSSPGWARSGQSPCRTSSPAGSTRVNL